MKREYHTEEKLETIEDVIADMRQCNCDSPNSGCHECQGFDCRDVRKFADRIEVAYNRVAKANKESEVAK